MTEQLLAWLKALKPIHWVGFGSATVGAVLHVIFWDKVKDAVGDFFGSMVKAAWSWVRSFFGGSAKHRKFTGYQFGRLVQKVKDQGREIQTMKKDMRTCTRSRSRCEAKTVYQDKKISALTKICDSLTERLLDVEKKIV
jgi:hypothetical protein